MSVKINLKMQVLISVFLTGLVAAATAVGGTIHVDGEAAGADNGTSWENAYSFLQDALADGNYAAKPVEIRVAQGIYTPDSNSAEPNGTGDRTATFQLINGVTLKGGYAGFGQPDPNARDIDLYETILSGDLDGNDVYVNNPEDLWWGEPTRAENSYHVVTGSGTDATATLDGFTITGGNANVFAEGIDSGGGMYNEYGSSKLNNCTFMRNSAGNDGLGGGGGIYNKHSSPTLFNCTFSKNSAFYDCAGGGMLNDYSNPTLTKCTFIGNTTEYSGGGMGNWWSNPTLTNCIFTGNFASFRGGGMHNDSGSFRPTLANCIFVGNQARQGGGIYGCSKVNATLVNCTFSGNSAVRGGAIYNEHGSSPTFNGCKIVGNISEIGAGVYFNGGEGTVDNCVFIGNVAYAEDGGAMYNAGSSGLIVTNCTFGGNEADDFGASLYNAGGSPVLKNCILWNDAFDEIHAAGGEPIVTYCNVQGGWPGEGNKAVDPCFLQLGYWDLNGTPEDANDDVWVDGDYHLKSQAGRWDPNSGSWVTDDVTSPCIDAGNPMTPIGHEPFPNGGIINMGAYGGTAQASKSYFGKPPCKTIIAGDINGDCIVNFLDFRLLAAHWLQDNTPVNSNSMVGNSVEYYIQADKFVYHLGENVEISYRVTNLGETAVDVGMLLNCGWAWSHFVITDNDGTEVWEHVRVIPPCGWIMLHLEPQERREDRQIWNMMNDNGTLSPSDDFPVGPGSYTIMGELQLDGGYVRVPVSVSIEIRGSGE